jgi:peptidoglycan/xylan/chitin deacetylase (PgdA/CDA1 family)
MTNISPEKQEEEIKNTDSKIYELFQVKPQVFIPPENIFDSTTINILKKYGYNHLSADTDNEIPQKFVKSDFYYFNSAVWTAKLIPATGYWNPIAKEKILEQVNESLLNYGYAVVMMHPFEFSNYVDGSYVNEINQTKFTELKSIITDLKSEGHLLIPVGKIDKYDTETFQNKVINQTSTEDIKPVKEGIPNCNCVAFKIVNVEDYWLNDVQNNLISTFSDNEIPVTVSILGKFFGADPKVVDFLKQKIQDKNNQLTVAIGGWESADHSLYSTEEQSSSIKQTNKQLSTIFGFDSNIFSPPFGKFNNSTLDVLKQNNISYISSVISTDSPNLKSTPIHIPETSYIPNLLEDNQSLNGTVVEKVLAKIQAQQKQYGYALVSMQPSDFAVKDGEFKNQVNKDRIQILEELISHLKENNIKIVSLTDIPQEVLFEKYPAWIRQIYVWHEQGQITDMELDSAINNLISRMIIITH